MTRSLIAEAFVILLGRRGYDGIRVSDITRKAGVGRATFYAHFDSKDALLRGEIARLARAMLPPLPSEPCLLDATKLFAHVQQRPRLFRSVLGPATRAVAERIVQDAIEAHVLAMLEARPSEGREQAFVPRFVASTLLTLMAWALDQPEQTSPERLQQTFAELVGGALAKL